MRSVMAAFALVATLAVAAPVSAQQPSRPVSGGDETTMLFAGGLTFLNWGDTGVGAAANVLFNTLKVTGTGRIGIVGDVGLNHFEGATVSTIMGGGRYTFTTSGKVVPYGQFLVGIVHTPGDTDFNPSLGLGVDIAWRPNLNFRGEVSFIFHEFDDPTRWFFGVSTPIKKK
jgi:hypothetical protein